MSFHPYWEWLWLAILAKMLIEITIKKSNIYLVNTSMNSFIENFIMCFKK